MRPFVPTTGRLMHTMPTDFAKISTRALDSQERISEVLFGLIMVLGFTGSLSVAGAGREDVRTMIIGALGCNLAWGIIDAVFYLMGCLADRGRNLLTLRAVRGAADSRQAEQLVASALPPIVASVLEPAELAAIHQRVLGLPEPPRIVLMTRRDALGALGVFLLVFLSTFPVAAPFLFVHRVELAMRLSNAVALVMLLMAGIAFGRVIGRPPWLFGVGMVGLGLVLVSLTIALGG
jgi:hypothetical protein